MTATAGEVEVLPVHPTGIRAIGVTPKGRVIWPIAGADGEGDPAAPAEPAAPAAEPAPAYTAPASQQELDKIVETRLARERSKYGATPEEVKALQTAHDKLQFDLSTEHEQALTTAKTETATEVAAVFMPQLVTAKLEAAAARSGIAADDLAPALEFVDPEKFLTEAGDEIDPEKIAAFVKGIAPANGNGSGGPRIVRLGQGHQQATGAKAGDQGRAMAEKRFAKPQQQS